MDNLTSHSLNDCAIVVGAGVRRGIGGALCARFAAAGLHVYAAGRSADKVRTLVADIQASGGSASAVTLDATNPQEVSALYDQVAADGRIARLVVFNASEPNIPRPLLDMTPEYVEQMWRVCCLAGFLVGKEAIVRMLPQSRGTLLFTGATASLRGRAQFGGFAAAKAGLRAHAQSMAREFGPKGIHVGHVIVDGVVNGDRLATAGNGLGKAFLDSKGDDGALNPDVIAEAYWQLHLQHRSAWTHELNLRPFSEAF